MLAEYKFYGKYKNVRNAAWRVFIEFEIKSLPVSTMKLARSMDITVASFVDGKELIELWGLQELCKDNNGFTAHIGGQWYIFFDGSMHPRTRIRFTIAHELGHILLGHEFKIKESGGNEISFTEENTIKERKKPSETEADMFALRLLAPACVLWGLEIKEAEDISTLCGICLTESKFRAKRMEELYARGKFLTHDLERKVFAQFKNFIDETKLSY